MAATWSRSKTTCGRTKSRTSRCRLRQGKPSFLLHVGEGNGVHRPEEVADPRRRLHAQPSRWPPPGPDRNRRVAGPSPAVRDVAFDKENHPSYYMWVKEMAFTDLKKWRIRGGGYMLSLPDGPLLVQIETDEWPDQVPQFATSPSTRKTILPTTCG